MPHPVAAIREIADEIGPDLVAAAPTEQFALFTTLSDDELDPFAELVREDCAMSARCISPNVYRFRDGQWVIAR